MCGREFVRVEDETFCLAFRCFVEEAVDERGVERRFEGRNEIGFVCERSCLGRTVHNDNGGVMMVCLSLVPVS